MNDGIMAFKQDIESNIRPSLTLPESEESWSRIAKSIEALQALSLSHAAFPAEIVLVVRSLHHPLTSALHSERTRLSGAAVSLLTSLAATLTASFDQLLPLFFPALLLLCARTNKVFASRARACILAIIDATQSPAILPYLVHSIKDKSAPVRLVVVQGVFACMNCFNPPDLEKESRAVEVEGVIRAATRDANAEIRKVGRQVFEAYKVLMPSRVERFTAPLSPTIKKYLDIKPSSFPSSSPTFTHPPRPKSQIQTHIRAASSTLSTHALSSSLTKSTSSTVLAKSTSHAQKLPAPPTTMPPPDYIPVRPPLSKSNPNPAPPRSVPASRPEPASNTHSTSAATSASRIAPIPASLSDTGGPRRVPLPPSAAPAPVLVPSASRGAKHDTLQATKLDASRVTKVDRPRGTKTDPPHTAQIDTKPKTKPNSQATALTKPPPMRNHTVPSQSHGRANAHAVTNTQVAKTSFSVKAAQNVKNVTSAEIDNSVHRRTRTLSQPAELGATVAFKAAAMKVSQYIAPTSAPPPQPDIAVPIHDNTVSPAELTTDIPVTSATAVVASSTIEFPTTVASTTTQITVKTATTVPPTRNRTVSVPARIGGAAALNAKAASLTKGSSQAQPSAPRPLHIVKSRAALQAAKGPMGATSTARTNALTTSTRTKPKSGNEAIGSRAKEKPQWGRARTVPKGAGIIRKEKQKEKQSNGRVTRGIGNGTGGVGEVDADMVVDIDVGVDALEAAEVPLPLSPKPLQRREEDRADADSVHSDDMPTVVIESDTPDATDPPTTPTPTSAHNAHFTVAASAPGSVVATPISALVSSIERGFLFTPAGPLSPPASYLGTEVGGAFRLGFGVGGMAKNEKHWREKEFPELRACDEGEEGRREALRNVEVNSLEGFGI